jgi:hypothetical protein
MKPERKLQREIQREEGGRQGIFLWFFAVGRKEYEAKGKTPAEQSELSKQTLVP